MSAPINGCAVKRCTRCPALIVWVRTKATASWMPIDAAPVSDGNVVIEGYGSDARASVMSGGLFDGAWSDGSRYVSHFKTCPAASAMRKKR